MKRMQLSTIENKKLIFHRRELNFANASQMMKILMIHQTTHTDFFSTQFAGQRGRVQSFVVDFAEEFGTWTWEKMFNFPETN